MLEKDQKFLRDMAERAAKTAVQAYFTLWTMTAVLGTGPELGSPKASAFNSLFTLNNLKAAAVGAAYSLFTSILSKPVSDDSSASLVE